MKLKYLTIGLIAGILLATAGSSFAANVIERVTASIRDDFKIQLDGEPVQLENAPLAYKGASYLPVRELATLLGKEVDFEDNVIKIDTPKEDEDMPGNEQTQTYANIGEEFAIGDTVITVTSFEYKNRSTGERVIEIYFDVLTAKEPTHDFTWSALSFISGLHVENKFLTGASSYDTEIRPEKKASVSIFFYIPEGKTATSIQFNEPFNPTNSVIVNL